MTRRPNIAQAVAFTALDPRISRNPETGCWLWLNKPDKYGYAKAWDYTTGKHAQAHRLFYQHANGAIPSGLVIDHVCRVRICVNPAHLRVVTRRENTLAPGSLAVPARNAAKTHCPSCGGPFTTIEGWQKYPLRRCTPCTHARQLIAQRNSYRKYRAARLAYQKAHYRTHRAARLAYQKAYYLAHKDTV